MPRPRKYEEPVSGRRLYIPDALWNWLEKIAFEKKTSVSAEVTEVLKKAQIEDQEKENKE